MITLCCRWGQLSWRLIRLQTGKMCPRWLRQTNISPPGGHLSPYLQEAFTYATKVGTPIIMAMDLGGLVSLTEIEQRISKLDALKGANVPGKELVSLLQGIQGITLGISIDDSELGAVRVDFADSAEILAKVGKPLLLEILKNQGAMIDDFEKVGTVGQW